MCRINHFPQGWCLHVNFCSHVNTNQDGCHWHTANIHRAPEKNVHLNDFWHGKSWENLTKILQICPPHLSDVATLPCEIQKCHFQQYYSYTLLVMLSQKKTNCNPLAHVTTLTCELQNFLIWLKVCCVLSNAGGSEKSQLWVVIGGSGKNWLWCGNWNVRQAVSHSRIAFFLQCFDTVGWAAGRASGL